MRQRDLVLAHLQLTDRGRGPLAEMDILEAAAADLDQVEGLWRSLYRHHRLSCPEIEEWVVDEDTSWARRRLRYQEWFEADRAVLCLVRIDKELVGYAMVEVFAPSAGGRGSYEVPIGAELQTMSVAVDWRGRGVGSALFDRVREHLAQHGVAVFTVGVMSGNDLALEFYAGKGSIPWVTNVLHRV